MYISSTALMLVLLPLSDGFCSNLFDSPNTKPINWKKRQKDLLSIVNKGGSFSVISALDEMAGIGNLEPEISKELIRRLPALLKNGFAERRRLSAAIASSQAEIVPFIMDALDHAGESLDDECPLTIYLGALSRLGPKAKGAIPQISERLNRTRIAELKPYMRLALANMGKTEQDNLDLIVRDLNANPASWSFAFVDTGPHHWVDKRTAEALAKALEKTVVDKNNRDIAIIAMALGTMDEKAAAAVPILREIQAKTVKEKGVSHPIAGLSLARIDKKNRTNTVKTILRDFPKLPIEKETTRALLEMPQVLVTPPITDELLAIIGESDAQIAERASALLTWAGSAARVDVRRVLEMIEKNEDRNMVPTYKYLLMRVSNHSHIPMLEAAMAEEKRVNHKQSIREAISAVEQCNGFGDTIFIPNSLQKDVGSKCQ